MTDAQRSLFDAPPPFRRGSDTSEEAAQAMAPRVAHLRRLVLKAFRLALPEGKTPDEVASLLGLSVLAIRPRCTELYKAELLEHTGEKRANQSGLKARVLRARL
jgi:hypothetical protein